MKNTGMIRRIDDLGRIVIPKELRSARGIREGDPMEIYVDDDFIILRKYATGCVFCGETDSSVREINGTHICSACAAKMASMYAEAEEEE